MDLCRIFAKDKSKYMCETDVISHSITKLSKRSFAKRLDYLSIDSKNHDLGMIRLNNELDKLYDLLYDSYPTITAEDYIKFRPYLKILIETLSELYKETKDERLGKNISALSEINNDIQNFKVNLLQNIHYEEVINRAKQAIL